VGTREKVLGLRWPVMIANNSKGIRHAGGRHIEKKEQFFRDCFGERAMTGGGMVHKTAAGRRRRNQAAGTLAAKVRMKEIARVFWCMRVTINGGRQDD